MTGQSAEATGPDIPEDEELELLRHHPHWIRLTVPTLQLATALAVLALFRHYATGGWPASGALFLPAIPFGIALARRAIEQWSTSFVATTRKVGARRVFLSRRERHVWLLKVNDIRLYQGPVQRVLGCGDLVIESSGEADQMVLRNVLHVNDVYQTVMELVRDEEDRRKPPSP
jgi:hypothetical protein